MGVGGNNSTGKAGFGRVGEDGKRRFLPADRKTLLALGVPLTLVGIPMLVVPGAGIVVTGVGIACLGKAALSRE